MKRDTLILAAVLLSIAGVILGGSVLCTWAIAHGASMQWRLLFRLFCHGIPHRCFYLWGVPMPICARCTAIYVGALSGILLFWIGPRLSTATARITMYVLAVPMGVDGLTQLVRLRESNNNLRVLTGIVAGIGFTIWALTSVERYVPPQPAGVPESS